MTNRGNARDQKRSEWFKLGARAVQRLWPEAPWSYVCPLCWPVKGFLPSALQDKYLTLEHAPPKAFGGKEVALTCRNCNNRAGAMLESEMISRNDVLDLALGTMKRQLPGTMEFAGLKQNVLFQSAGGSLFIVGSREHNAPENQQSIEREWAQKSQLEASDDLRFTVALAKSYKQKEALIGWLRAAYLVAFAALGYRYIFNPIVTVVRQQLANPSANILRFFSTTSPSALQRNRLLMIIEEPPVLQSLIVQMGRTFVFLPWGEPGEQLYARLEDEAGKNLRLDAQVRGKIIPWPHKPELALDFV